MHITRLYVHRPYIHTYLYAYGGHSHIAFKCIQCSCIHIYIYQYIHIYIYIHICIYECVPVCISIRVYVYGAKGKDACPPHSPPPSPLAVEAIEMAEGVLPDAAARTTFGKLPESPYHCLPKASIFWVGSFSQLPI